MSLISLVKKPGEVTLEEYRELFYKTGHFFVRCTRDGFADLGGENPEGHCYHTPSFYRTKEEVIPESFEVVRKADKWPKCFLTEVESFHARAYRNREAAKRIRARKTRPIPESQVGNQMLPLPENGAQP